MPDWHDLHILHHDWWLKGRRLDRYASVHIDDRWTGLCDSFGIGVNWRASECVGNCRCWWTIDIFQVSSVHDISLLSQISDCRLIYFNCLSTSSAQIVHN